EHGARNDVLRGDQFDLMTLATEFLLDRAENIRIGVGERTREENVGGGRLAHPRGSLRVGGTVFIVLAWQEQYPLHGLRHFRTSYGINATLRPKPDEQRPRFPAES